MRKPNRNDTCGLEGRAWPRLSRLRAEAMQVAVWSVSKVEPGVDYFSDLTAHTLLEVVSNAITYGLIDPKQVYVLRWIAGKHAGVPEFAPSYTITGYAKADPILP